MRKSVLRRVVPLVVTTLATLSSWAQFAAAQPPMLGRSKDPIQGAKPEPAMDASRPITVAYESSRQRNTRHALLFRIAAEDDRPVLS